MSVQKSTWSCTKLELCMSVKTSTVACVCHIEFNKLYISLPGTCTYINSNVNLTICRTFPHELLISIMYRARDFHYSVILCWVMRKRAVRSL